MKIIAMIPARMGSKRIKNKNIRFLGNKPLICHILDNAKKSKLIKEIYINSESKIFDDIAKDNNVNFYKRKKYLSSDKATNDEFAADFLENVECDILIQLLPTSPFLDSETIDKFIKYMVKNKLDTLISTKEIKIECLFKGKSLNFDKKKHTPPSQLLNPVDAYACGIMGWRKNNYLKNMKKFDCAYHGGIGKVGYYKLKGDCLIDIDNEEDFDLANHVYRSKNNIKIKPNYYSNKNKIIFNSNVKSILKMDGVENNIQNNFNNMQLNLKKLIDSKPKNKSWSHTLINSESNSATLIAQLKGEGNRMHFHPDWNEWWYIIKGKWQWNIEGKIKVINQGDIVFIEKNKKHKITSIGKGLSIRLAVSRYDVDHVYLEKDFVKN